LDKALAGALQSLFFCATGLAMVFSSALFAFAVGFMLVAVGCGLTLFGTFFLCVQIGFLSDGKDEGFNGENS
jgi:hypothetical protein